MSSDDAVASPYSPPQTMPTPEAPSGSRLRWVVAVHCVAVLYCLAYMTASRRMLVSQNFSEALEYYGAILLVPALVAWLVCPVVVVFLAARYGTSPTTRVFAILAEVLLWFAQLATMVTLLIYVL